MAFDKDQLEEVMGEFNYFGLARLKPGVSVAQANAEINALQRTITGTLSGNEKATLSAALTPFQQSLVGDNQKPLLILLAAVAGLLLVGCVNITNLLLARAVGKRQSMAIAAALGASRAEMLRLSLRETAVMATLGGALGILLAAIDYAGDAALPPSGTGFPRVSSSGLGRGRLRRSAGHAGNAAGRRGAGVDDREHSTPGGIAQRVAAGQRVAYQ